MLHLKESKNECMTNKDNGFCVRVHNENRINTSKPSNAANRNDDFDEWCKNEVEREKKMNNTKQNNERVRMH